MNVLVINGSPKADKSNTMYLTNKFIQGAGWTQAEIIHLSQKNIQPCKGCFACWNKTPGNCVLRDDMNEILEKIIAADVIVWSFPLYYFSVPGPMKNLIDRQLPLNLPFMDENSENGEHPQRYDLSHQKHLLISTCGFWTPQGNYNAVLPMFDHFLGPKGYTPILCGQGDLFPVPELKNSTESYLEIVKKAGAEFSSGKISEKTRLELDQPIFPKINYEAMANASWGLEVQRDNQTPTHESLTLTSIMAALYRPDQKDRVLEIHYTDIDKTYQLLLSPQGAKVITEDFKPYTTRLETPFTLWRSISSGETKGRNAFLLGKFRILGDRSLIIHWDKFFGIENRKREPKRKRRCLNLFSWLIPLLSLLLVLAVWFQH